MSAQPERTDTCVGFIEVSKRPMFFPKHGIQLQMRYLQLVRDLSCQRRFSRPGHANNPDTARVNVVVIVRDIRRSHVEFLRVSHQ